jgi:Tfp pilus assembly protein PilF
MAKAKATASAQPDSFFSTHYKELAICVALGFAVWVIFAQTTDHGIINFDDYDYFGENPVVLSGLTWEGVKFAFTTRLAANWHPLTWISLMADVSLFGPDVGRVHGMSAWMHAGNAMLLFALLRYLTGAIWRSAAVAALFAVHPLHVEPVAWLSDRKDLVATFFWFLTLLAWGHWVKKSAGRNWWYAAHVFAAMALLSKPTAVMIPVTILLIEYWPLGKFTRFGDKSAMFALSGAMSVITFLVQRDVGATLALHDVSFAAKLANTFTSYGTYLFETVVPVKLAPMYPFPEKIAAVPLALSLTAIGAISWLAWRTRVSSRYLAAGWLWYLTVLLPMAGIVQVGIQSHADRYTYVSLIGIFWMVAWGLNEWFGEAQWKALPVRASALAAIAFLIHQAHGQAAHWRDDLTLFNHALDVTSRNRLAHSVIGLAHLRARQLDLAESHLRVALEIDPKFMPSYRNLAEVLHGKGQHEEALRLLNKAVELVPEGQVSYYDRGIVLKALNKNQEALADFDKAISMGLQPDQEKRAYFERGILKNKSGDHDGARTDFERAIEIDPNYYLALKNLAYTHYNLQHFVEAKTRFLNLAHRNPEDPDVKNMIRALAKIVKGTPPGTALDSKRLP